MKIKGVVGTNSKVGPRGTPIELEPKAKVIEAVKESVSKGADQGFLRYCDDVTVSEVSAQSLGVRTDGKPFANNSYQATGNVVVRRYKAKGDHLYPAVTMKFKIQFEDTLDGWGMPELKVNNFELE